MVFFMVFSARYNANSSDTMRGRCVLPWYFLALGQVGIYDGF